MERYDTIASKVVYLKSIAINFGAATIGVKAEHLKTGKSPICSPIKKKLRFSSISPTADATTLHATPFSPISTAMSPLEVYAEAPGGRMLHFDFADEYIQDEFCIAYNLEKGAFFNSGKSGTIQFNTRKTRPAEKVRILGDGNCLFRALSYCLTSSEDNHAALRMLLVQYVEHHKNEPWAG
jgi:hypothetical protein